MSTLLTHARTAGAEAFDPAVADTSLVIEGGGMRGFFTAGILAVLREHGILFPHVVGVSSGALNAAAYLANKFELDYAALGDSPLALFRPAGLLRPRTGLLHTDRMVQALAGDCWDGVMASPAQMWVPAVDAQTGNMVWWGKDDFAPGPEALRERMVASASIPVCMPQVVIDGRVYADGGIIDSIPVSRAEQDGYRKHVLILSRPRGYVKGSQHLELYLRHWLRPFPKLKQAMLTRHIRYNAGARYAEGLEDGGRAFVFRMDETSLGRFEYSPAKFKAAFEEGRVVGESRLSALEDFLGR